MNETDRKIVDDVPCARCGDVRVELTSYALELAKLVNRAARVRGIQPLRKRELALCDECAPKWRAERFRLATATTERDAALWASYLAGELPEAVLLHRVSDPHTFRELIKRGDQAHAKRTGRGSAKAIGAAGFEV